MITTTEAAAMLHVSRQRVLQFIKAQRLPAVKPGRDWQIDPLEVAALVRRPTGRPAGPINKEDTP